MDRPITMQEGSSQKKASIMEPYHLALSQIRMSFYISLDKSRAIILTKLPDLVLMVDLCHPKTLESCKRRQKTQANRLGGQAWCAIIQGSGNLWLSSWNHSTKIRLELGKHRYKWESLDKFLPKLAWHLLKINTWSKLQNQRLQFSLHWLKILLLETR